MRLQFDRESDESYQEKRTRSVSDISFIFLSFLFVSSEKLTFYLFFVRLQSGAVMRTNVAIERHASKVYTRKMFELFGENLFKGGAYQVEEVVRKKKYIARHDDAGKREKWSKVDFEVTISDDGDWFDCECGQFAHMGMQCCHALKVIFSLWY